MPGEQGSAHLPPSPGSYLRPPLPAPSDFQDEDEEENVRGGRSGAVSPARDHDRRPRTPDRQTARPSHDRIHQHTPMSSPSLPSPMSFYHLGPRPSPLALLRGQLSFRLTASSFSSGPSRDRSRDGSEGRSDDRDLPTEVHKSVREDLTQDSKDVLIDRLNDVVKLLSGDGSIGVAAVDILHAKVDDMEQALSDNKKQAAPCVKRSERPPALDLGVAVFRAAKLNEDILDKDPDKDLLDGDQHNGIPPLESPGWLGPQPSETSNPEPGRTASSENVTSNRENANNVPVEVAHRLANEAQRLHVELSNVLEGLRARREESDHLVAMLVERAEGAARRILSLEDEVAKLEDELGGNESELGHLRLRLRALEVMCYEYVPEGADPELRQSIENWKSDWTRLKKKMTARRRERNPLAEVDSTITTPTTTPA